AAKAAARARAGEAKKVKAKECTKEPTVNPVNPTCSNEKKHREVPESEVSQRANQMSTEKTIESRKEELSESKTESKSKAELRAERRAKQEAQRAAKQKLLSQKVV
ncbi:hypothetical protein KM043_018870, partial [Ampulex compressa]